MPNGQERNESVSHDEMDLLGFLGRRVHTSR